VAIAAIETRYAGCRFRSRLEARWAVFFNRLGIRWEYEPEGFQLDSGLYLPDFLLPDVNSTGVWFEVKPSDGTDDDPRWGDLAIGTNRPVIVAFGMSRDGDPVWGASRADGYMVIHDVWTDPATGGTGAGWDNGRAFCICPTCKRVGIQFEGRSGRICGHPGGDERDGLGAYHPRIDAAYTAANSARFEHGERG
jgi:hypothetical protein